MEEKLSSTSATEFEDRVYDKSSLLRDYFVRRTERFDGKFTCKDHYNFVLFIVESREWKQKT